MKQKIFESLKQEYKSLGLSDASLMLHAELLAGLGTVNDENLAEIVSKQESYLKGLQSENDKRVSTAIETARKKFTDEQAEAQKKAEEEARAKRAKEEADAKKAEEEKAQQERIAKLGGLEKQFEEYKLEQQKMREKEREEWEKRLSDMLSKSKTTEDALAETKKQLEEKAKAEKAAARSSMITAKAKELGITESRIKEGFVIPDDMDDEGINSYLTTVANNLRVRGLPTGGNQRGVLPDGKPNKEDVDKIASSMLG